MSLWQEKHVQKYSPLMKNLDKEILDEVGNLIRLLLKEQFD